MRLFHRTKRTWQPSWALFPGLIGDAFAMYFVDVGACAQAPVPGLPVRLDGVLLLTDTDAEGMPAGAELRQVQRLDGELGKRCSRLGGHYIGRVITAGTVRYTCHLPELPGQRLELGGRPHLRITVEADPEWSYVSEQLRPDPQQLHIVGDLSVVNTLLDRGDPLAVPRPVDHIAHFPTESGARAAAGELTAHGFAVSVAPHGKVGRFVLEATRTDPVSPPQLHQLTWTVRTVCEQHGGGYDGWACPIVR